MRREGSVIVLSGNETMAELQEAGLVTLNPAANAAPPLTVGRCTTVRYEPGMTTWSNTNPVPPSAIQMPTAQDSFWMAAASLCRALERLADAQRKKVEAEPAPQ